MLRLVAFENLINFKDRQCLELKEGVNFLVGANSTGKSSILELIRRCHSVNLSSSVTNLLDDSKTGYVISRYEGLSDVFGKKDNVKTDRAILCYLQDRDASLISIYKCICFESNASGELHIAASLYERNDDSPEKMIRRFSLQNINDDSIGNFIDVYFPKEKDSNQTEQNGRNHEKQDEGDFGIGSLFEHGTQEYKRIELDFLTKIKEVLEQSGRIDENETSEILLEKLQSSFAHVFPVRSIGPLQWINGNNVREIDASKNYKNVHKRAEILWDLLPPEEPQRELLPRNWLLWITSLWSILSNLVTRNSSLEYENVDENEHSIFKRVTYPLEYVFVKDTKQEQIKAFYKNDPGSSQREFQMVKTPEGIIEAKQATLILSHKKFKTICYEDIDRGMHTQMIENMNTFLLKAMKGKTVIIVTHNPSLINGWALGRTHVCTRTKRSEGKFVNIVRKIPDEYAIKYGVHHEMKKVLFSARVLLVEGPSDLNVLRALFDYILSKKERSDLLVKRLKNSSRSDDAFALKEEFSDNILRVFSLVQCVSVTGVGNFGNAKKFCEDVNITFKVLTDNDDICLKRKLCEEKLESFMVPQLTKREQNTFMWKSGTIEDALRTDSPLKISEILGCTCIKTNCTGKEWERKKGHKDKLKRKINNELSNNDYDGLFDELFKRIENNQESEFLEFFKFITDQD